MASAALESHEGRPVSCHARTPALHLCWKCSSPAELICVGCKDAPAHEGLLPSTVFYCSDECQKLDWDNHKDVCRVLQQRKSLYRAGKLLREIWLIYQANFFDSQVNIQGILEKKTEITVHIENDDAAHKGYKKIDESLFRSKEQRTAVLSALTPVTAAGAMAPVTQVVLAGISKSNQEVIVQLRSVTRPTIEVMSDIPISSGTFSTFVTRVQLDSGEEYALNLTCASYGWTEIVMPWQQFLDQRVENVASQNALGTFLTNRKPEAHHDKQIWDMQKAAAEKLWELINSWNGAHATLAGLVQLSSSKWRDHKSTFLRHLDDGLGGLVHDMTIVLKAEQKKEQARSELLV